MSVVGSDPDVLADTVALEELGRVVDHLRLVAAAQVEFRSRKTLGEESLAFRNGARDGVELVRHLTGVSHGTAKARVGLGSALAPRLGLLGEQLHARYTVLADAMAAGRVGVDAARVIVDTVQPLRGRVETEHIEWLVESLTDTAAKVDVEGLKEVAAASVLAVDPDGPEPKERARRRKRAARIGRTLADGTTTLSVVMTPEDLAFVRELFAAQRRGQTLIRTTPGGDESTAEVEPEWREHAGPDGDPRTRAQQDHDTLFDALHLAADAAARGEGSIAELQETVVTITASELAARDGQGWTAGVLTAISVPTIERRACTGGVRLLVTGEHGEPLHLGRSRRAFSAAQKRALTAAAGGRCQYPGCRTPAPFLEAHHARWWQRDEGPTDIGNGTSRQYIPPANLLTDSFATAPRRV